MNPLPSSSSSAKDELRQSMRARLRELGAGLRAEASLVICQTAAQLPAFRSGKCIALFAPLPNEPDIHPLIEEAWAQGKQVALPRMFREENAPHLDWHVVQAWDEVIAPGPFGLREPDPDRCPRLEAARLDCIFVPGVAFDRTGLRLGRGGGYYDCFLGQGVVHRARFGLMFACQQVDRLPREPHDQALPAIVTEDGLILFEGPGS
jgi:5-formyltetrahydrofolate cyclo-ligase